jgi:folate-binding protein YgfZ
MTAPQLTLQPFVVSADGLRAEAVLDAGAMATADVAVVDITGPGAVACVQGLVTNDVEQPGDGAFLYAALLTPKGMIVSDIWAARSGGAITLTVPQDGLAPLLEILRRSLPPRLARATDRTAEFEVVRVLGPRGLEVAASAGLAVPSSGRVTSAVSGGVACTVARPDGPRGPFALQIQVARPHAAALRERLVEAGAAAAGPGDLELARILAGWPRLGAEIDHKTLPQEVRYDELGGVSYTKGCYTGQETVARLHFRGHPNRQLVGVEWETAPDLSGAVVSQDGRDVGRVSSAVWLAPVAQHIGLAVVRREIELPQAVSAAGAPARLVALPLEFA